MPTAFVTGGSGFVGGALDRAPAGRGLGRPGAGALGRRRRQGARARRAGRCGRPRRRRRAERGSGGLRGLLPRRGEGRGLGRSGRLRASQRARDRERDRRLSPGGRAAPGARRHGGRADGGRAARESRRATLRCAPTPRCSTRRPRRRPSCACARPTATDLETVVVRPRFVWGKRRHHAAARPGRAGALGALSLGRRRRPAVRTRPTSTTPSRGCGWARRGRPPAACTS